MVKKYVLTGGVYSGKTALLNALENKGYQTVEEAALMIINEELKKEDIIIRLLPWLVPESFEEAMLYKRIELESQINKNSDIVFIDRGIPDGIAYVKYNCRKPTEEYVQAMEKYRYEKIFLCTLLPNYKQNSFRQEPPEMRKEIHRLIEETYKELNYNLIHVPVFKTLEERVEFVLEHI